MISKYFFRSTIFNLCYYILIAVSCILLLPALILPRRFFLGVVHYFVHTTSFLERMILGLKYEIRGLENLPKDGKFIIAAKHQSAYETTKLHILFKDPAIVLKRELLKIPLWGWYLAKSDQIAINRSTPKKAIESIKSEANRMAAQNRPIIIFPQGTRVAPETIADTKPYKIGVVRVQEATRLPIIPMAINTGTFYPRNAWIKKPGTVIFEFLKPIDFIDGTEPNITLKKIETAVEQTSNNLRQEALEELDGREPNLFAFLLITLFICVTWTANWIAAANLTKTTALQAIHNIRISPDFKTTDIGEPIISGFPFKMTVTIHETFLQTYQGHIETGKVTATSWPILGMPINIKINDIKLFQNNWQTPLNFESLVTKIKYNQPKISIKNAELIHKTSKAEVSGEILEPQINTPIKMDLKIAIYEHSDFLNHLQQKNVIDNKAKLLTSIALNTLLRDGAVKTTLSTQENKLYLGLIKIHEFPKTNYQGTSKAPSRKQTTRRPAHLLKTEDRKQDALSRPVPPR